MNKASLVQSRLCVGGCGEPSRGVERQSGQFSRDGAMANLMKTPEVIVTVAFEPLEK